MILGDPEIKTGGKNRIGMKFEGLKLKEDPEYRFGVFERKLQIFWREQNLQIFQNVRCRSFAPIGAKFEG